MGFDFFVLFVLRFDFFVLFVLDFDFFFLGFDFSVLCFFSSKLFVLGFDLYLVVIQTQNHLMVLTRSTDDPCHQVQTELSVDHGSIFRSPDSLGSDVGQLQTQSDPSHGQS